MDLRDIEVVLKMPVAKSVGPLGKGASLDAAIEGRIIGRKVIKQITLYGRLSERETQVLRNSARFCPVSQLLSGKSLEVEDAFEVVEPPE
jgi:hypothetical protein